MTAQDIIDCDVHVNVPNLKALLPYLDDHWREQIVTRGIGGFETNNDPPNSPAAARPDWMVDGARPSSVEAMREHILDPLGTTHAICNCLYGGPLILDSYMSQAVCAAINDWIAAEWLDKEPRLRASVVVSLREPELAVREIERMSADRRFVQVLMLTGEDMLLGRRYYWPIYEAAQRHGMPVALHGGSTFRTAPTACGWPTYFIEHYSGHGTVAQNQLASLVSEGVFQQFPDLRIMLLETGFSWLPSFLWRFTKIWKAARIEVPWVDRSPTDLIRERVRISIRPFDGPRDQRFFEQLLDQISSEDVLVFASDYPHWHFDTVEEAVPAGLSPSARQKLLFNNAKDFYGRL